MEGLKRFPDSSRLPTDFNSLLILLTVNSLCSDELLFLMWVTEFREYLSRKAYIYSLYYVCKGELHETYSKMPLTQLKATAEISKWPGVHSFSLSETQAPQKRCIFLKNHLPLLSEGYLWCKTSELWIKYFFQVIGVRTHNIHLTAWMDGLRHLELQASH